MCLTPGQSHSNGPLHTGLKVLKTTVLRPFQLHQPFLVRQSKVKPLFGFNKVVFVTAATQVRDGEDKAG